MSDVYGKVHYKHGNKTFCGLPLSMSIKVTTNKKKVTCKTCKASLRYQEKVKRTGRF